MTTNNYSFGKYDAAKLSDEQLVARAQQELLTITKAYEELMRRYQPVLYSVCVRYLGNERDADDVCQEIMLKVLYGLKKFEGKSKFKTWLYSITYNECTTQYRKEARKKRLLDALSLNPQDESDEDEQSLELGQNNTLDRWLAGVNPIDREIIILRFVAELEFQDIAHIMNLGLSATKMRYKRAIDRLKDKHAQQQDEHG